MHLGGATNHAQKYCATDIILVRAQVFFKFVNIWSVGDRHPTLKQLRVLFLCNAFVLAQDFPGTFPIFVNTLGCCGGIGIALDDWDGGCY